MFQTGGKYWPTNNGKFGYVSAEMNTELRLMKKSETGYYLAK